MDEALITPSKKRLIGELIKGRDSTIKLRNLFRRRIIDDGLVSAEDLVKEILGSFSGGLSVLNSWGSGEFSPDPATTYAGSTCSDDRTWDSIESEKKPTPVVKDRRGCYKRRKTEDSRVKIADTIDDGYAWRKYGQKEILNAKNPRCYFRCTHKGEGCKAIKQVQKLEDGSEMFHITYFGYHTCQNMHNNTHMFSDTQALSFYLHNFEDYKIKHSPSSLSTITNAQFTPSMDQEDVSNAQSDDHQHALWKDIIGNLESSHDDIFKDGVSLDDFRFD